MRLFLLSWRLGQGSGLSMNCSQDYHIKNRNLIAPGPLHSSPPASKLGRSWDCRRECP